MINFFRQYGMMLGKPNILFWSLLWLMVILLIGTVSQKTLGLYLAHKTYFATVFFWLGPIPLPGGYPILTIIFMNLLCKLIFASPWHLKKSGTIVTHLGVLMLLLGGFITAGFSYEGNMVLREGERSNIIADYHQRHLVIFKEGEKLDRRRHEVLKKSMIISSAALPFKMRVLQVCRNCLPVNRGEAINGKTYRGLAEKVGLSNQPLEKEDESNIAGFVFELTGAGEDQDGIYLLTEVMGKEISLEIKGDSYLLTLRRQQTKLPFSIELIDFERETHPGTNNPRRYQSRVKLIEGDMAWETLIEMNEPLRYKGYTFYQASFIENEQGEISVLAVVKNMGRLFPYIASIIMCIGLLIHLFLAMPRLMKKVQIGLCFMMLFFSVSPVQAATFDFTSFSKTRRSMARTSLKRSSAIQRDALIPSICVRPEKLCK